MEKIEKNFLEAFKELCEKGYNRPVPLIRILQLAEQCDMGRVGDRSLRNRVMVALNFWHSIGMIGSNSEGYFMKRSKRGGWR